VKTLAVACLILLCAAGASGGVFYPDALIFEPGYASGPPPGFPLEDVNPDYGDPLTIVGRVAGVGQPFEGLLPAGQELTYVFEGASCTQWGVWDDFECLVGGIYGTFQNGTVAFYLDSSPDANFAIPQTFRDGELVLLAQLSSVLVLNYDPTNCPSLPAPDVYAYFMFVGGSWFSRVSNHGVGWNAVSEGELDGNVPPDLQALGYTFRVDGSVDIDGPVATSPTTWGRVKALYR
jgi:hypothetical protein